MNGNYIKVSRSLLDWCWYHDVNTCRLFIHMLLRVNWKKGYFGEEVIERGSFVSSISKLSAETGLSEREVRTALEHLKKQSNILSISMITITLITREISSLVREEMSVRKESRNWPAVTINSTRR